MRVIIRKSRRSGFKNKKKKGETMTFNQAKATAYDCRKLASFYRTRDPDGPLSEQERLGLASLLAGVADLIETTTRSYGSTQGNVVNLPKRP